MKKAFIVLVGITIVSAFTGINKVSIETTAVEQMQKIIIHSVNILDNGSYRNNYDSVKVAIQELSSIYSYLEQLKKSADSTKKDSTKP